MSYFLVDILTPTKKIGENLEADSVFIPTRKGEIQILPEHTHLIAKLELGILKIQNGIEPLNILVGTGVAKVNQDKVTLLCGFAEKKEDIDPKENKRKIEELEKKIKESNYDSQEGLLALHDEWLLLQNRKVLVELN